MRIKISIEGTKLVITLYSVDEEGQEWRESSDFISLKEIKDILSKLGE